MGNVYLKPIVSICMCAASNKELSYKSTLVALKVYHGENGHLAMPRRFRISEDDEIFPIECRGKDLAAEVYKLKWWQDHVRGRPDRVSELNELGFIWTRLQNEWNLIVEAIIAYVSINGDTMVPYSFIVPSGDSTWPIECWGLPLGNYVYRIRARQDFVRGKPDRVRQLNMLNFVWDLKEHMFWKFFRTLQHYREHVHDSREHKVLRVPSNYVVPESSDWPPSLHNYPLGAKCQAIRQKSLYIKNHPERRALLEKIGFQWSGNADLGWLEVVHSAAIYSQMHGRVLDVPLKFVVPAPPYMDENANEDQIDAEEFCNVNGGCENGWPWPEHLWGFPLGQRLKDVRLKGAYLKGDCAQSRIAQLNALGFIWNPKRGRKKRNLGAVKMEPEPPEIILSPEEHERSERSIFSLK